MIQAIALLKACLALLMILGTSQVTPEFRAQVMATVQEAVSTANAEIAKSTMQDTQSTAGTVTGQNEGTPGASAGTTAPIQSVPVTMTSVASQAGIEIVSPISGKGLGRTYKAADSISDESNYIVLGAVVYGDDGAPVDNAEIKVWVENSEGKVELTNGSGGNVMKVWKNGVPTQVPVFQVEYEFQVAGPYTFTFSANGYTQSVTLNVN